MSYRPRRGLSVPVLSIVDPAGHVVEPEQRSLIRHVIANGAGADVVFANGTTGEWNRLKHNERRRLMRCAVDEVAAVNAKPTGPEAKLERVEVWLGLNGDTRDEVLANLDLAIEIRADAVVIAPLAIGDLDEAELVRFFLRELDARMEKLAKPMPVYLYDNADIHSPGHAPHIRTRTIKALSRLPWVVGLKVSASRKVLGNYTKAALHFKEPGEFGIYIGNALLMFDWFRPRTGWLAQTRQAWHDWLLHGRLPIGVVAGPANLWPDAWRSAWRACWNGDLERMSSFQLRFSKFAADCRFRQSNGVAQSKEIACLKAALGSLGIIGSTGVLPGTPALTPDERNLFLAAFAE